MQLGTLCYIEKDNKTLMLHRVKKENDIHNGMWIGLGGKIESGESPEECIIREVQEESGLIISNPILRGILTFPNFKGKDWYVFLYSASDFTGELGYCSEGELEWIENHKIQELTMSGGDKLFLRWMKEKRMFSAKFIYDEDRLIDYSIVEY